MGNAAVLEDNKTFLRAMAKWVQDWQNERISNYEHFFRPVKQPLHFVLTSIFQSDTLERRYGQYRQMSGGRLLIGLKNATLSKAIIKIKSLLKKRNRYTVFHLSNATLQKMPHKQSEKVI